MEKPKFYIICGNRNEFETFIREKCADHWVAQDYTLSFSDFVYVSGADNLRGVQNPRGYFYGSWKDRKDLDRIFEQLFVCNTAGHGDSYNAIVKAQFLWTVHLDRQSKQTTIKHAPLSKPWNIFYEIL